MKLNNLKKSLIYPGDILKVKPILRRDQDWLKISEINWDNLINPQHSVKSITVGNGPYNYDVSDWKPWVVCNNRDRFRQ